MLGEAMCRRFCPEASDDMVTEAVSSISDRLLESKLLYRLMNYLDKEHRRKIERWQLLTKLDHLACARFEERAHLCFFITDVNNNQAITLAELTDFVETFGQFYEALKTCALRLRLSWLRSQPKDGEVDDCDPLRAINDARRSMLDSSEIAQRACSAFA